MVESQAQWATAKRLASYFSCYRAGLIACFFAVICFAVLDAGMVYLVQPLIDDGLAESNSQVLQYGALLVIAIFLLRGLASFVASYCTAWVSSKVIFTLRQQSFEYLLRLPMSFYDQSSHGSLISKLTYDTEQIAHASAEAVVTLLREGLIIFVLLAIMVNASWKLSLLFLALMPVIAWILNYVAKHFRRVSKDMQDAMGDITQQVETSLSNHTVIRACGTQGIEGQQFKVCNSDNRRQVMRLARLSAISNPVIQMIGASAIAVVLLLASNESLLTSLTPGSFTTILVAMGSLLKPLKQISKVNEQFQRGLTAANSIFTLLDAEPELDHGTREFEKPVNKIQCRNLSFQYPNSETQVLRNIQFELCKGQTLALVGRSGSGKSTLVNLLLGFYPSPVRTIYLNDQPLEEYRLAALRSQFALVSQDIALFNISIADNIAYGCNRPVSREQIEAAAAQAFVSEFSDLMPQGLDSFVGENGALLSGGQKQRIAIARAILRDAPICIFDEATSALDSDSEAKVQLAMQSLQKDRCCILIAHRLTTVKFANSILVLDKGRIVECGDHDSLLAQKGLYSSFYFQTAEV
ncbi:lipid A export permease/ATP-binding protein MsbA [Paraneptunicella aestuarii]|uniref:lipid A export permease/ATP-binding protein MsbA n=1 Tax=Paraneptunicella aestuarii TaxID=2831148 RepID=UPI001E38F9AD|nr:lipid A export permease/ATP-binding protein MsbA [Paraneptunicella aestuarii]UAA39268.1 lipid A export permease/ATP-binding protein MsbA [Paraneptunicella aestuarii]